MAGNYDILAEAWDEIFPYPEDLDFWAEIPKEEFPDKEPNNIEILELGSGTGRVSLYLCKKGYRVHGLEVSPTMKERCLEKLEDFPPRLQAHFTIHQGDMRSFNLLPVKFDLIICTFSTWLDLLERPERISTLKSVYAHLKNDGIFVIDVVQKNLSDLKPDIWNLWDYETRHKFYPYLGTNSSWCEYTTIHPNQQLQQIKIIFTQVKRETVTHFNEKFFIKLLKNGEIVRELEDSMFNIKRIYGTYEKQPWDEKSPRMIFLAQRQKEN